MFTQQQSYSRNGSGMGINSILPMLALYNQVLVEKSVLFTNKQSRFVQVVLQRCPGTFAPTETHLAMS